MSFKPLAEMSVDELRAELLGWVGALAHSLSKDATTYLYVKPFARFESLKGLGGGNFLVALGCVSSLELYSGIYAHLSSQARLWTVDDVEQDASLRAEVLELGLSQNNLKKIARPTPVVGDIKNACETTRRFLIAMEKETSFKTGLPTENDKTFCKLWNAFRNNLAHSMSPALGTTVCSADHANAKGLKIRGNRFRQNLLWFRDRPLTSLTEAEHMFGSFLRLSLRWAI